MESLVPNDHQVIVSGLANNYINYIATPEEYSLQPFQDYEGGATVFGTYTLNAIIQSQEALMKALNEVKANKWLLKIICMTKVMSILFYFTFQGKTVDQGPIPPNFIDKVRDTIPDRIDIVPNGKAWGDVIEQPEPFILIGTELKVVFVTPSLRHNPLRGGSHCKMERQMEDESWELIRTDADLDTT